MEDELFTRAGRRIFVSVLFSAVALLMPSIVLALGSVTLAWNPSQGDVAGYTVYYGTASQTYTHKLPAGTNTTATVSGLRQGTSYFFVVTAYNPLGLESHPSNEVSYQAPSSASDTYNGLFYEETGIRQNSAGSFKMSVSARGAYSGRLQIGPSRYSFSGRLDSLLQITKIIHRPDPGAPVLELSLGPGPETGELVGQVTDRVWVSSLLAFRAVFKAQSHPAPYAGSYTLIVPGQDDNPAFPAGHGFGGVRVDRGGVVYFAGILADGNRMTESTLVSGNGLWPFYIPLHSGKQSVMGWMAFTNQADSDLSGTLTWIKQADARERFYSGGFTNQCQAVGSEYIPPVRANPPLNFTGGSVVFSGGNLVSAFSKPVAFGNHGGRMSGDGIVVQFSSPAGTFKGQVTDPITDRPLTFRGAVLQKQNTGYGFLLLGNQSSRVSILP